MNRTELLDAVARRAGVPAPTSDAVLTALVAVLESALREGEDVRWPGVLTVERVDRPARSGRNPSTGEPLEIPARRAAKLTAGSRLKAAAAG